ncbi:MAG: GNAT family N-acetyltransferase [Bacteroidota bacterium]|nr:GNAT family N-acetyltransferase [Bacteroidota bacterium]
MKKTFEWFLTGTSRFLFFLEDNRTVAGYCGGYIPKEIGEGSSSGMLQYAFTEALKGIIRKPWLLVHKEVRPMYPFLWKNISRKIFKQKAKLSATDKAASYYTKSAGLVVIGVAPVYRGTQAFPLLMNFFDEQVKANGLLQSHLSVKKNNPRAIKAYKKMNWQIIEDHSSTYVMQKQLMH